MPCRATQNGQIIAESPHKTWFTGGATGKPLQISCYKNPMNTMKRKNDIIFFGVTGMTPPQAQKLSNMLLGKSGGQLPIVPERMKRLGQSRNDTQLWMCLVSGGES